MTSGAQNRIMDPVPGTPTADGVAVLGAHPKAISERWGHTEIGVTINVYGHLFEGAQGELTQNLDDLLERSRSAVYDEGGKRADGAWKRACHTGHQRSLPVNNGHSKTGL